MNRRIEGHGIREHRWRRWWAHARVPSLARPEAGRLLVVAPHPDDEVLAAGGLIARLAASGTEVTVLSLTDGEAAYGPRHARDMAARRPGEAQRGLERLLGASPRIIRMGLPDGGLAHHVGAIAEGIAAHSGSGALCLTPHERDGHPDHEAAARAALLAGVPARRTLRYPVWLWHWCRPGQRGVDWARARAVRLTADERARKAAAVAEHRSQLTGPDGADPVLPPHVLERFARDWELVFT